MSTIRDTTIDVAQLVQRYCTTRKASETLSEPLTADDYMLQAMPDVSPHKWHLAHVTWFFETFLLKPYLRGYSPANARYEYLFNSYYNAVGPQFHRPSRALISRPTVDQVYHYRRHVDDAMLALLEQVGERELAEVASLVDLGINHEQQHQELMIADLKYNLSMNPLRPAYHDRDIPIGRSTPPLEWIEHPGGIVDVGCDGDGFAFDDEGPRHEALLHPHRIASRLVTNGEFMAFMAEGGYQRHDWWLSQGWSRVSEAGWQAPLYWERIGGDWWHYTLSGMRKVDPHAPVSHVSYFEADAYARWAGCRLPTEFEWEHQAAGLPIEGNFAANAIYHPLPLDVGSDSRTINRPQQMYGDVWEWTGSAFLAYPGFKPLDGAPSEYNGKFMLGQMVLRGGSAATPRDHVRATYRNFFYPPDRWQFKGFRLAQDA